MSRIQLIFVLTNSPQLTSFALENLTPKDLVFQLNFVTPYRSLTIKNTELLLLPLLRDTSPQYFHFTHCFVCFRMNGLCVCLPQERD